MDKQDFAVCFWMMFLRYLEGFWQKTIYHGTVDSMSICKLSKSRKLLHISNGYMQLIGFGWLMSNHGSEKCGLWPIWHRLSPFYFQTPDVQIPNNPGLTALYYEFKNYYPKLWFLVKMLSMIIRQIACCSPTFWKFVNKNPPAFVLRLRKPTRGGYNETTKFIHYCSGQRSSDIAI